MYEAYFIGQSVIANIGMLMMVAMMMVGSVPARGPAVWPRRSASGRRLTSGASYRFSDQGPERRQFRPFVVPIQTVIRRENAGKFARGRDFLAGPACLTNFKHSLARVVPFGRAAERPRPQPPDFRRIHAHHVRFPVVAVVLASGPAWADLHITRDHGGYVEEYKTKYARIRDRNERVIIDGICNSACTLVFGIVPMNKICVTPRASIGFHQAYYDKAFTFGSRSPPRQARQT